MTGPLAQAACQHGGADATSGRGACCARAAHGVPAQRRRGGEAVAPPPWFVSSAAPRRSRPEVARIRDGARRVELREHVGGLRVEQRLAVQARRADAQREQLVALLVVLVERALLRGVRLLAGLLVEVLSLEEGRVHLVVALERRGHELGDHLADRLLALEGVRAARNPPGLVPADQRLRRGVAEDAAVLAVEREGAVAEKHRLLELCVADLVGVAERRGLRERRIELPLGRGRARLLAGLLGRVGRGGIGSLEPCLRLLRVALDDGADRLRERLRNGARALHVVLGVRNAAAVVGRARGRAAVAAIEVLPGSGRCRRRLAGPRGRRRHDESPRREQEPRPLRAPSVVSLHGTLLAVQDGVAGSVTARAGAVALRHRRTVRPSPHLWFVP